MEKKKSKSFFIELLVLLGILTIFIQDYINYFFFLLGMACLFIGIVACFFTRQTTKERAKYVSVLLLIGLGVFYLYHSTSMSKGITLNHLDSTLIEYEALTSKVPNKEDGAWLSRWNHTYHMFHLKLNQFEREQTHLNRFWGLDFIATTKSSLK